MTENDYLDQIRFRIETAERRFGEHVRALHGSQAAESGLKSGATIAKTLKLLEDDFASLTDEIIAYLGKTLQRTTLDRTSLLSLTAQFLMQAKLAFESIASREKLLSFASGKRIEMVIDEALARLNTRLTLRLREFSFGLDDSSPPLVNLRAPPTVTSMNSREFRERVLIALYRRAIRDGVQGYYDPKEVCEAVGLKWRPGQLRTVMSSLDGSGLVRLSESLGGGDDGGMDCRLTQEGIEQAEYLIEHNFEYEEGEDEVDSAAELVPASNRYVQLSDNQRAQIKTELQELGEAIRGSNEIGDEDRLVILGEIAVFEATIAVPRVSTELVDRFVQGVLKKLVAVLSMGVAGVLAERLIATLGSIF